MDLLTIFTILLICHVWLPAVPTGLLICLFMTVYLAVNVQMAQWRWSHFKLFYGTSAALAAYSVWGLLSVNFSWNLFYAFFVVLVLAFRYESYNETSGKMSTRRKLMIASWDPPKEGNILGVLQLDMTKTKEYIAEFRRVTGVKITITHLVIKAVGKILKEMPSVNGHLVMGRYYPADTADVGCLVGIDTPQGPDLANAKICQADEKGLGSICAELQSAAQRLREGKDKDFNKTKPLLSILPTFLLRPIVGLTGWLGSLGISIKPLGVQKFPFGTAMITSVGMMGLDLAFVPQTPFAHVPFIVMVGAIVPKPVVVTDAGADGAPRVVPRDTLTLTVTVDHRFLDGSRLVTACALLIRVRVGKDGAKMAVSLARYLESPDTMEKIPVS